ncbi:release factor glutamine methyltransferase [Aureimonas endophytica]|uniref:Release factor glutamine methyltransferase n=1 Tax=Aureimonas endophytica TaxID=2027858 RepID=A0A916ZTD6_9HYPH|nr:peptide chain release factor N(5)-glutamine methyltransferase [Aureimonas endophytica]GGE13144.1 release factor glutamine methyltransferase [Aureimonas endophytica]
MTEATATTVDALLREARARLRAGGAPSPDLDARLFVSDALGLDAAGLILKGGETVPDAIRALVAARVARRLQSEPAHRILGRRAFYAHEFKLSPATLEPRPDTEILVDLCRPVIEAAIAETGVCRFVDVGTGSGAIAVSLLALYPEARAEAVDISAEALATAMENAAAAGVAARMVPLLGDHLAPVRGAVDLVVSNPPYIPSAEIATLAPEVREHDPRAALDGGPDGLRSYRALAAGARQVLGGRGHVAVEIGAGQGDDVVGLFAARGFAAVERARDLAGIERALLFRCET